MSLVFGQSAQVAAGLDDHALALALATEAGRVLLAVRAELTAAGADSRALKDAGDRASQQRLAALLARARPTDSVLSEEAVDDLRRLDADRVWIIDPLDGTREFAEAGRRDWAVHVALWERGRLVAGAVTQPAAGQAFATVSPGVLPSDDLSARPLRFVVSRSRPPSFVAGIARATGAELMPMGSAGAKAMAVLTGVADAYLHAGGQYEWDSAAPVAVAAAFGAHTSRIDGAPLVYNQADPYLPDLLICRPELAARLLAELAGIGPE